MSVVLVIRAQKRFQQQHTLVAHFPASFTVSKCLTTCQM